MEEVSWVPYFKVSFVDIKDIISTHKADLEFFSDILLLDNQFRNMTEEVIGVGLDLSPHYRAMLEQAGYITSHPDTVLGLPGRFQGLNMGVVLFRLEKMRKSKLYNSYVNTKMDSVLNKSYKYDMTLAH